MKVFELNVGGNLREQRNRYARGLYTKLLAREWNGKAIWQQIRDQELTAAPCMVGAEYMTAEKKVMIVGRAVNGWQVPFDNCETLEDTARSVYYQTNRLHEFEDEFVIDEITKKKYYYAKSPFLRLMRKLVKKNLGIDDSWSQKIVWSNLYKVAPRDGKNPSRLMFRNELDTYIQIMDMEIKFNQPDLVVFVTDDDYFEPYPGNPRYPSFYQLFAEGVMRTNLPEYICALGTYRENPESVMVVCKRPERRSTDELTEQIMIAYQMALDAAKD